MVKIDAIGRSPKIAVDKTNYVIGNNIEIKIDNVEIYLDIGDFEYLLEQGGRALSKQGVQHG